MTLILPAGCTLNGRSEIIPGRAVLHFTDSSTNSDFTVVEANASEHGIQQAQRKHREAFFGSAFAPPV